MVYPYLFHNDLEILQSCTLHFPIPCTYTPQSHFLIPCTYTPQPHFYIKCTPQPCPYSSISVRVHYTCLSALKFPLTLWKLASCRECHNMKILINLFRMVADCGSVKRKTIKRNYFIYILKSVRCEQSLTSIL